MGELIIQSVQPQFDVNVRGRVKNLRLPQSHLLMPLFDAIVNSFQAIDDSIQKKKECTVSSGEGAKEENYYINIIATYEDQTGFNERGETVQNKINGFIIEDNGIGFDDENFESFITSDSSYKEKSGGRGVGRFLWLKEFESVVIDSVYQSTDVLLRKRHFVFGLDQPYIIDYKETESDEKRHTIVQLELLRKEYSKLSSKKVEDLAMRIVEYCLAYFLKKDCPKVTICGAEGKTVNLNELCKEKITADSEKVMFNIGDEEFTLLHVLIEDPVTNEHKLHLMADERDVTGIKITSVIVDLKDAIEKDGKKYWYAGFLYGDYLDVHVNENRTSIDIDENDSISQEMIVSKAAKEIEQHFQSILDIVRQEKKQKTTDFITNKAPEYRALMKHKADELNAIEPGLTDDKLDERLYKINREFEKEITKETESILKNVRNPLMDGNKAFDDMMACNLKKITDANRSTLAQYVTRRKAVLDLMKEALNLGEDSRYQKEKYVHDMIFPRHKTSDDMPEDQYNLWLIDEKLAFFFYLASDMPFNGNQKEGRPDLLFLDQPIAVTDDDDNLKIHDTIVIFELKRPQRDDYNQINNPIQQMYDYVARIQEGGVKDYRGRPINVNESTKFYLYAICDITPTLKPILNILSNSKLTTPDRLGRFWFNGALNAYVEVIPFSKMITDSRRRNEILFKKLGL